MLITHALQDLIHCFRQKSTETLTGLVGEGWSIFKDIVCPVLLLKKQTFWVMTITFDSVIYHTKSK